MLRSRIIPCLLIHKKGLVKTVNFKQSKYVGDPINAVKIFNEKEVDELMVIDIDKTRNNIIPDFQLIQKLANESRMPLCYGGGIKTLDQAVKIIEMGVEKVALSSIFLESPEICNKISNVIGAQSISIVLDVKKKLFSSDYNIFTHNATKKHKESLKKVLNNIDNFPFGELVINSIDRDGTCSGYDDNLIEICRNLTERPITVLGGAGSLNDISNLINKYKIIGAGAGSLFVFKGKYKAVLINYPNKTERKPLYNETNNTRLK